MFVTMISAVTTMSAILFKILFSIIKNKLPDKRDTASATIDRNLHGNWTKLIRGSIFQNGAEAAVVKKTAIKPITRKKITCAPAVFDFFRNLRTRKSEAIVIKIWTKPI